MEGIPPVERVKSGHGDATIPDALAIHPVWQAFLTATLWEAPIRLG